MTGIVARVLILALAGGFAWLVVLLGRRYVERRRRTVLSAPATSSGSGASSASVRILAFSSEDCTQCHRLQRPALRRVQDALGQAIVEVVEIDGPSSPELTTRYNVLTVPTTVVLDSTGHARAVNYGFANAQKLLSQVDAVLSATHAAR